MILKTEGIVLKTFDLRETSRIGIFFTKDHGKLKGVFKGIRKDHRKFGSTLDKFSVNHLVYYYHENADLHLVGQCDLKDFFFAIRQDYRKTMAANYMAELVNIILPPEEKNEDVYRMMLDFLNSLELSDDVDKLVHIFQVKILLLSGFRPHIDSCLVCDQQISDKAHFSLQLGGLVCLNCKINDATASLVSRGAVASILHIEKNSWQKCLRLGFSAPVKKELRYVLNNFLVFHLGRSVKTARYL